MRRRRRKSTVGETHFLMDADDQFARHKAAMYLKRTLAHLKKCDVKSLELLYWIVGGEGMRPLLALVLDNLSRRMIKQIFDDVDLRKQHALENKENVERFLEAVDRHGYGKTRQFFKEVNAILDRHLFSETIAEDCPLKNNLDSVRGTFRLSEQEAELVAFVFFMKTWEPFRDYYEDHLECHKYSGKKHLAAALGTDYWQLQKILSGQLFKLELVTADHYSFDLDDSIAKTLQQGQTAELYGNFFKEAEKCDLPLKYHLMDHEVLRHVLGLLKEKRDTASHILLYGPPGTGKTSFARAVAAKLGCPAYEIIHQEDNTAQSQRRAIQACLNMTNTENGSLMIVDEAESLLENSHSFFNRGEIHDKGWLNHFLETPGVRALWITNSVDGIDESTKRRFSFSLHFEKFTLAKRTILWRFVLKHHGADHLITAKQIVALAGDYEVSAGAMATAVQKSMELFDQKEKFHQAVRRSLDAYQTLLSDGRPPKEKRNTQKDYSLEGLNYKSDGVDFVGRIETLGRKMTSGAVPMGVNALFFGPPGTGKSEMAKYLGQRLDRKVVVKLASDILDPYVGMSERNIAEAFQEAKDSQGILVVDEVDTFLSSRNNARRSWEVSMVNEFLTQMEHFKGILICTTNNYSWLDKAALRRFLFKVEFDFLLPEGNVVFYRKMLGPLIKKSLTKAHMARIQSIRNLTPGDFRIVRDKTLTMDELEMEHSRLIESLEFEARAKERHGQTRKVGF